MRSVTSVPGHFGPWSLHSRAALVCRILAGDCGGVSRVTVRFTVKVRV